MGVIALEMLNRFVGVFLVVGGLLFFGFLRQRAHFLFALVALEMTRIVLMARVISVSGQWVVGFVLLALGACEVSLGLAILVLIVRTHGNDLLISLAVHTR